MQAEGARKVAGVILVRLVHSGRVNRERKKSKLVSSTIKISTVYTGIRNHIGRKYSYRLEYDSTKLLLRSIVFPAILV